MSKRSIADRNRKNSESSSGPSSPEGKARSSQNSLVHGMYAESALLPTEDPAEYLAHQAELEADLKPDGAVQRALAHMVSDNIWRMKRLALLETRQADLYFKELAKTTPTANQSGFVPANQNSPNFRNLETLGRYNQRIQNGTLKALKALQDMQKEIRVTYEISGAAHEALVAKIRYELRAESSLYRYRSADPFSTFWQGDRTKTEPPQVVFPDPPKPPGAPEKFY